MKIVEVDTKYQQYEILIGQGALALSMDKILNLLSRKKIAIVTDSLVNEYHGHKICAAFEAEGVDVSLLVLPNGEATKSWAKLEEVSDWLLGEKIERDDIVIAFGGGVIGDLVGFAASILRRGVRFVQIPTSLLAQVDSSVGGKTGINAKSGKNLIGAFHQPELVVIDLDFLDTLSDREFRAGYGEVLKYGLLGDRAFFEWLDENRDKILQREPESLTYLIGRSCEMKAAIVSRDEKEKGDRALLNLGHTFGHALERLARYDGRLLHGEAISMGMILAFQFSKKIGAYVGNEIARIEDHMLNMKMKYLLSDLPEKWTSDDVYDAMTQDKKVTQGNMNLILVKNIGEAYQEKNVDKAILRQFLKEKF